MGYVSNIPSSAAAATQSTNVPSNAAAVAAQSSNTMLIDVPLAFIKAFRLRGDKVNLTSIVLERFDQAEIEQSKQSLWEECQSDLDAGGLCFYQRRSSDRRAQIEADLDDVLAAFDLLDSKALIPPIFCEASELHRLPSQSLDPVSEQEQDNTKALLSLTSVVNSIEKKTSSFFDTSASTFPPQSTIPDSQAPLSYSAVVTEGAQVESHLPSPREATYRPQMRRDAFTVDSNDRRSNLLVFSLPETSSLMETKEKVDNNYACISVRDLFRIGRFKKEAESTSRPVLVKLSSAWDRKVVLLNKRKLKSYHISCLFVREDLAPELRKRSCSSPSVTTSGDIPWHTSAQFWPSDISRHTSAQFWPSDISKHTTAQFWPSDISRHSSGPVTSQGTVLAQ